ncbi:MAG: cobalamin-binding protein, partial [Pseudomonadota bacterium]|nr:cobalamin-binding protein [Pseudomonadota bacterium]
MRIVSLLPSATELVCALGLQQNLVGRSHECDWPLGLRNLPVLTQPKMNPMARAATIDNDVRRLVEHGVSVYMLDADKLADLAPDVIVTQSQCELCAVSFDEVEAALNDWMGSYRVPPKLVSLEPMTLDDVMTDIRNLSVALKCEA